MSLESTLAYAVWLCLRGVRLERMLVYALAASPVCVLRGFLCACGGWSQLQRIFTQPPHASQWRDVAYPMALVA